MRRGLGPALGLACLAVLAAPAVGRAAPVCASDCQGLFDKGELRETVTVQECAASVCHQEGRNLYRQNKHQEALASLDYVRETLHDSPSYLLDRGLVLYALERFEEALATFDEILEARPTSLRAGAQRAHTLARLGKLELAQAQFEAMFEWPGAKREFREIKTTSYLRGNIGMLKLRRGDLPGGKRDLEEALKLDGNNEVANMTLNRVVPALEDGTLSPEGLNHLTAASEAIDLGQAARAQEAFRALLEDSPRYAPAYLILAQGLIKRNEFAECENLLRLAEQRIPDDVDLSFQRIRCTILRVGPSSRAAKPAIAELKTLAAAHPDNALGQNLLIALDER
jgi:tetratricopeptide (TPR) repeat protein